MSVNQVFIANVKRLCKVHGVTMKKLLENCGLNKGYVYDIEKRDISPSIETLYVIANYFGVSTDSLLTERDQSKERR